MYKFKLLVFLLVLISWTAANSQPVIHSFFPTGVRGDLFADTLINTPDLMKRLGIRQIDVRQQKPNTKTITHKTFFLNEQGNIAQLRFGFSTNQNDSSVWLVDSLFYDSENRTTIIRMYDAKKQIYMQQYQSYSGMTINCVTISLAVNQDTVFEKKFLDEKGRTIKSIYLPPRQAPLTSFYFYNGEDGLLDSISYDHPSSTTTVFTHAQTNRGITIQQNNFRGRFTWIYNLSLQCISSMYELRKAMGPADRQEYLLSKAKKDFTKVTETKYFYNPNGTLARAIEKTVNEPELVFEYSYK